MASMQGKVALVTGASSGIGLSTATLLLASGAHVFGVDIAPAPASLLSSPGYAHHSTNLTAPDAPAAAIAACVSAHGRLDALLNVAGVMDNAGSVDSLDDDAWDRVIAVNLTAPVRLMREAVAVFRKQGGGGSIVNVASRAATSGAAAGVAYTASKAGLVGASRNVAFRFREERIRCNCIAPGGTATNIMGSMDMSKMDMAAIAGQMPYRQMHVLIPGQDPGVTQEDNKRPIMMPDQMAQAIVFLASDASSGISGAMLPVDNAWSAM